MANTTYANIVSNTIVLYIPVDPSAGIQANGDLGNTGDVLISTGNSTYWGEVTAGSLGLANVVYKDVEDQAITGGGTIMEKNLGVVANGDITPQPGDRAIQTYIANGDHALLPANTYGTFVIGITNGTGAGIVNTSSWDVVSGPAISNTSGDKYHVGVVISSLGSQLEIRKLN